jgi:alkylation response protein AidB-like acyl-CoA dehydrogenase
MDYDLTEDQRQFRTEFRTWLEENLPEGWLAGDRDVPEGDEREQFLRDWQRTLAEGGWAGIRWPEEYGGRGATLIEKLLYERELAQVDAPPTINTIGIMLVGPTLMELGTDEQKQRFIPNILDGEEVWCQGYSEPGAGSDVAALTTRAVEDGDRFRINGQKIWTSYAHVADWCILMTRTDASGTKHEGITALMVDMDQPGVTTERLHQINDDREFNQVFFDDAIAKQEHVLGDVDQGWEVIRTISSFEQSESWIFDIERRWEEIREYCETHSRDGEPLIEKPWIRRRLAEFHTEIQAGKLVLYRNTFRHQESGVPGSEGSLDSLVSKELGHDLEEFALDVLGPAGMLWSDDLDRHRWIYKFLTSFGQWIAAGTGDIQRNIIGEYQLGLPRDPKSKTSHRSNGGAQ